MKKIILILVFLSVMLSACNADDSNDNLIADSSGIFNNDQITNADQSESIVWDLSDVPQNPEFSIYMDFSSLTISTLGEYNEYMSANNGKIPDDFITYDKLSSLGDFSELVFLEAIGNIKYRSYLYGLTVLSSDGEQININLYVYHNKKSNDEDKTILVSDIKDDSLLTCNNKETGIYYYNGIKYKYSNGTLWGIEWIGNDGITFIYNVYDDNFIPNIVKSNEIIEKLCTKSGAAEAVKLFDEMINEAK